MRHPQPSTIADAARVFRKNLTAHGRSALALAPVLAARGYPSSTLGDGGSRGSDDTSSTERAALATSEFADVDHKLDEAFRSAWYWMTRANDLMVDVVSHAAREGLRPPKAGQGECRACGEYCSGAVNDRLRSGYCNACRMDWDRKGKPDRAAFERERRGAPAEDELLNPGHRRTA